jgi:hypothetical protein
MLVLGRIAHHAAAHAEDIAPWLGVPVVVAETLCADLEAAGQLHAARSADAGDAVLVICTPVASASQMSWAQRARVRRLGVVADGGELLVGKVDR